MGGKFNKTVRDRIIMDMYSRKAAEIGVFLILGVILSIISVFVPWVGGVYTLMDLYILEIRLNVNAAVYLFPIITAILLVPAVIIIFRYRNLKIFAAAILFLALGIYGIFLIQIFGENGFYLFGSPGVYIGLIGFVSIFWGTFWLLLSSESE